MKGKLLTGLSFSSVIRNNRVEMRISSQKYEVGEFDD